MYGRLVGLAERDQPGVESDDQGPQREEVDPPGGLDDEAAHFSPIGSSRWPPKRQRIADRTLFSN